MFEDFIYKLKNDRFITLETTPPHSAKFGSVIEKIKKLDIDKHIDGYVTTDNPLARLKYSSMFAAIKLQNEFKKPVITTISMRDKNKIALQSDLLGANEASIQTVLSLTGDPASASDQPSTKGVFEGKSTLLLDIVKCFNNGMDYAGKPFKDKPETIYPFAASSSYASKPKYLIKKIVSKLDRGVVGIITQPVFDIKNANNIIEIFEKAKQETASANSKNSQLILGFFPITKLRTAQFLSSHVPGINVPKELVDKLSKANKISEEEEAKVGFELSLQIFSNLYKIHPKIHIMTANNFKIAKDILANF